MIPHRLKELAEQAGFNAFTTLIMPKHQGHISTELEKFAELIVKECIDNIEVWELDSRNHISYMLARHFGVEE